MVGCFQVLAFIPGASRAGVTITGARFLNVKRDSAAIFTMLLSIPIILASLFLALLDMLNSDFLFIEMTQSISALIVSFITAFLSIHMMMRILKYTNFNIFIIYRIILGITLLVFYA
jgi:undecaprenyl-diphosphatase